MRDYIYVIFLNSVPCYYFNDYLKAYRTFRKLKKIYVGMCGYHFNILKMRVS